MERHKFRRGYGVLMAGLLWSGVASAEVSVVTVPVGNVGNARDPATGLGEVDYAYNIGKYDVTAGQYTAFLNAVAQTDTYGLYNSTMNVGDPSHASGIVRSGAPGSYTYSTRKDPNFPVNYVTFWDACRFVNWLQNGQPVGAEGPGTTETGTYTLTTAGMSSNTITRNTGSNWAVASENEWYKAAYYNPATSSYYVFPTQSNATPSNVLSATGTNNANYSYTDLTNYLTPVGAFAASPSPYGSYDQGGDVYQWNDTIVAGSSRRQRGGAFDVSWGVLMSSYATSNIPTAYGSYLGFRVSSVPEPTSLGILGIGVIAVLARRRRSAR